MFWGGKKTFSFSVYSVDLYTAHKEICGLSVTVKFHGVQLGKKCLERLLFGGEDNNEEKIEKH